MGYWPDVNPGDTFQPNAKLENEIRHRLNALNGFGTGGISAGKTSLIRIPVYNPSTTNTLPDGKAVSIDLTGTIARDCYPVVPYDDDLPCYGVLIQPLPPKGIGDCTLSGLAVVSISGTAADGNFAKPDEAADGAFVRTEKGVRIINVTGTKAVVMLGDMTSEYEAGEGINSDLISGGTISLNLIGVGDISVTPVSGSTNGQMQISYSGGGGGGGGGGGYIPRWGTHFHYSPQDAADKNWMYYDEIHDQTIVELYTLNPRHMTAGARGYLKGSSLSPDNSFTTAAEGYLFCFAEIACDGNATASNPGSVHAVIGYGQFKVCSVYGSSISVGGSVVIPIRANQTIELNMSNIDTSSSIIGMIFYENGKDYRYPDESE